MTIGGGVDLLTFLCPPAKAATIGIRGASVISRAAMKTGVNHAVQVAGQRGAQTLAKQELLQGARQAEKVASKLLNPVRNSAREGVGQIAGKGARNRFVADANATGAHSVFRRDPMTGKVTHYETYRPQTNPFNPNPWESVLRYDGVATNIEGHFNKVLQKYILEPHIHDPICPGGIRPVMPWEIPK